MSEVRTDIAVSVGLEPGEFALDPSTIPFRSGEIVPVESFETTHDNGKRIVIENHGRMGFHEDEFGNRTPSAWLGSISLERMVAEGRITESRLQESIERIGAGEFHVPVDPKAPSRCIDGRGFGRGYQVGGGSAGVALADRLSIRDEDSRTALYVDDSLVVIEYLSDIRGMKLGAHRGDHGGHDEQGNLLVGCGVIDGMPLVPEGITDERFLYNTKALARIMMGGRIDRKGFHNGFRHVLSMATLLKANRDNYFSGRSEVVTKLEGDNPDSVPTYSGPHLEGMVIQNEIPGETFDSQAFFNEFGIQAFGIDTPRSKMIAEAVVSADFELFRLAKLEKQIREGRKLPSEILQDARDRAEMFSDDTGIVEKYRNRFKIARFTTNTVVLEGLADGSLPLITRRYADTKQETTAA